MTPYSATLIDHVYTNKREIDSISGIIICDISDHFGIFSICQLSQRNKKHNLLAQEFRSYSPENINTFKNILNDIDFTHISSINCPNEAYDKFMETYCAAHDVAFPLRKHISPRKFQKHSAWITKGLVQSSIRKNKLLKTKIKFPTDENIATYKTYCNIYHKLLRKSKASYFDDQLNAAKCDMKKTWSILRTAMNKGNSHMPIPSYFNIHGTKIVDKTKIVNSFNTYFANIGTTTHLAVPETDILPENYMGPNHEHSMFLDPVTPFDIINITNKLKNKTSQGHDNISCKILKTSIHYILIPLTHIINKSLATGIVPNNMKVARVIPLFKSGDQHIFNNYRPISILPAFSKILEKVVSIKLMKFMESQNLLFQHQYGFRPRHSTIHPIIHLLNKIAIANDKPSKDLTLSVFIDLSKAFDTISHNILLKKMENLGIRGVARTWFENYLSNRHQYMELYGKKSNRKVVTCGVPQGSILGPILFLMYVNDIHKCTSLDVLSFADDTTILCSSYDIKALYDEMNFELGKLSEWFKANKLCLNIKKTKYILFQPNNAHIARKSQDFDIFIDGQKVDQISHSNSDKSFKFLGLHIDETLSWRYHAQKVCAKIST